MATTEKLNNVTIVFTVLEPDGFEAERVIGWNLDDGIELDELQGITVPVRADLLARLDELKKHIAVAAIVRMI